MPKGIKGSGPNASKSKVVANGGDNKYRMLEARVIAAENKVNQLLKGLHAGHVAAAKALPKQRPGRTPKASATV